MSKTIEFYRLALESEINQWRGSIIFEPGNMSILLGQQKKIGELEKRFLQ
jgi:hypothetical protein